MPSLLNAYKNYKIISNYAKLYKINLFLFSLEAAGVFGVEHLWWALFEKKLTAKSY